MLTRSRLHVSKEDVLAAKTVRISPSRFSAAAAAGGLSEKQRSSIANAVERALCSGLGRRLRIVSDPERADLTVHAVITHAGLTDPVAAGVSKVASVAPAVLGVPVPVPCLPIGLGSLSVEAEARGTSGVQQAAMVWARGANAFTSSARVSNDGDAYDLAAAFGADFASLIVTGTTPFGTLASPPSIESINVYLGGAPKYAAWEAFGRSPGLPGLIGERLGLPPDWTDKGTGVPPISQTGVALAN